MTLHWFRRPSAGTPGTLNACYLALDRHVVAGHADDVASTWSGRPQSFAELLSQVGAVAGALRALGVEPGTPVPLDADADQPGALALLALLRLGAVPVLGPGDAAPVAVRARVGDLPALEGRTIVVTDAAEVPDDRPDVLTLDLLLTAGRQDPAGCADVAGDAVLWLGEGTAPTAADRLGDLLDGPSDGSLDGGAAGEWPDVVLGPLLRGRPLVAH